MVVINLEVRERRLHVCACALDTFLSNFSERERERVRERGRERERVCVKTKKAWCAASEAHKAGRDW